MRSLNQLYLILWDYIKDRNHIGGLCMYITLLEASRLINFDEYKLLLSHFESQKPNEILHPEFLNSDTWVGLCWWWKYSESDNPVNRKAFIQKMIQITENQN